MKKKLISLVLAIALLCNFAIVAFAAPSVTRDEAPEIDSITVIDENGDVVDELDTATIEVTPVTATEDEGVDPEVAARLDAANEELTEADSIADLENGDELKAEIDAAYGEGTTEDLVVRELFDLQFSKEYDKIFDEGKSVVVKFDTNIYPDETLVVMIKVDGEWVVIPKEDIVINLDGSVEITFHEALSGPIVFLVDETPLGDNDKPVVDDDEGDGECTCILCKLIPCLCHLVCKHCSNWFICPCWLVLLAIIILLIVLICIIKKARKDSKEKRQEKRKEKIRADRAKKREAKQNKENK